MFDISLSITFTYKELNTTQVINFYHLFQILQEANSNDLAFCFSFKSVYGNVYKWYEAQAQKRQNAALHTVFTAQRVLKH